jgi:hypothetical protein
MTTVLRLKRAAETAFCVFGSVGNTELAGLMLWAILGMIASILVIVPGDQTAGGMAAIFEWLVGG